MKSLAIIGAGVSGLCTLKHALESHAVNAIVYEMAQGIGGTWVYSTGQDAGVTSALYQNMVSNQPKQIMELMGLKHGKEVPTYLKHEEVLSHLKQYCAKFKLDKYIHLLHKVENIRPILRPVGDKQFDDVQWKIKVINLQNGQCKSSIFDAVVICNGHHATPSFPRILGEENFTGNILHSQLYKEPCQFTNKDVLIVGAGASGVDIAIDIATEARNVYISHRNKTLKSKMPTNVIEMPEVSHFNEDGSSVAFVNSEVKKINSVIHCTGYLYSFPFLNKKCGITVTNVPKRIQPLFKHIVNIHHNSMLFVGVPNIIPVFQILNLQAVYAIAILEGKVTLPSKTEMFKDEAVDYYNRLQSGEKCAHIMCDRVFDYADYLSLEAGVENVPNNLKSLYNFILDHRQKNLCKYKKEKYVLNDYDQYIIDDM